MRNLLISIVLFILIVATALLRSVWAGLVYFAVSFTIILCLYWIVILSIKYYEDYKVYFEEDFRFYCAKLINSTNITSEDIENNQEKYIKKFKKTLRRDKIIDLTKIFFLASLVITSIIAVIYI